MRAAFTPDQIRQLQHDFLTVDQTYYRLMAACLSFTTENTKSREYVLHGFLRRLGILQRCIQNIYSIYPPGRADIPSREECADLSINLQGFVFNVFGCIDNLAWVWAIERRLTVESGGTLKPMDISFQKKSLRKTLPREFRKYLEDLKNWFQYMEDFRHALAHRIPLYIPPYTVTLSNKDKHDDLEKCKYSSIQKRNFDEWELLDVEQTKLGRFMPGMTHSLSEGSALVYFHPQVLADWNTVAEIADRFLAQSNFSSPA